MYQRIESRLELDAGGYDPFEHRFVDVINESSFESDITGAVYGISDDLLLQLDPIKHILKRKGTIE